MIWILVQGCRETVHQYTTVCFCTSMSGGNNTVGVMKPEWLQLDTGAAYVGGCELLAVGCDNAHRLVLVLTAPHPRCGEVHAKLARTSHSIRREALTAARYQPGRPEARPTPPLQTPRSPLLFSKQIMREIGFHTRLTCWWAGTDECLAVFSVPPPTLHHSKIC